MIEEETVPPPLQDNYMDNYMKQFMGENDLS